MDNKSLRLSTEDTATSMYLSFDAESTMSTACYKTMENMGDISGLSMIEAMEESEVIANKMQQDKHMNSTLEAHDDSSVKSPLKTVRKMGQMTGNTPLRPFPKNIMKEYKALCSTPSKEQLLKTVDVTRGSDATRCIELGIAFLGVDDEKPAYFPPPPPAPLVKQCEENKENALPEASAEGSTLSASSSVEIITSVIERKLINSVSTVGSITEEESIEEIVEEILEIKETLETTPKANEKDMLENMETNENKPQVFNEIVETTPKDKIDHPNNMETIAEISEKPDELTPKVNEELTKKIVTSKSTGGKLKIAVFQPHKTRRSVCEPNLQTNKPSRILNAGRKRQSLLPTSRKSTTLMDAETEIPLLMSKMLKISNNTNMQFDEVVPKTIKEPINEPEKKKLVVGPNEKRRSVTKTRTSLIPSSAAGEKRPFGFTQRMSVLVKTTLNSPARKIARRSAMGTAMPSMQRRSMMPTKTITDVSKAPSNLLTTRRSMLPKSGGIPFNNRNAGKTLQSVKETSTATTIPTTQTNSLYPLKKVMEESKLKPPSGLSYNKPDASFTCSVCKEKFCIKSLLDAHKRSHENDNATPAFVKKPSSASSTTSISSIGSSNQCKYCDKKFALVKALHIHLLQNCTKIPPADKRKLHFTELNHVEKAQLPNVFSHHNHQNQQSTASSTVSSAAATPRNAFKLNANAMTVPKSSLEPASEKKDNQKSTTANATAEGTNMAPPQSSIQKLKKSSAHAGVYRTPSKSVPCHLCKLTFKSILDYTNHSLTAHGSNKSLQYSDKGNME